MDNVMYLTCDLHHVDNPVDNFFRKSDTPDCVGRKCDQHHTRHADTGLDFWQGL